MKRIILLISILLSFTISGNAELINNGDGTITDTDTNLMWLQDANYALTSGYGGTVGDGRMYPNGAAAFAESVVFAGYDDWRLPSSLNSDGSGPCFSFNCTDSEMGHLYYTALGNTAHVPLTNTGDFQNLQPNGYWSSTPYYVAYYWWYFNFNGGPQTYELGGSGYKALIVRDCGGPCPTAEIPEPPIIPEPISSILFFTGGSLLAGRRYFKKLFL